jgi:hypothetical protein
MNTVKGVATEQNASVAPDVALKKQLQKEGLRQAVVLPQQQTNAVNVSVSQTRVGGQLLSIAMSKSVQVDNQEYQAPTESKTTDKDSLFDFKEVAKNVMNFVGGVIKSAANNGADDAYLENLFSQAREGVSKGIAMAEQDIGGFMDEDTQNGINNAQALIEQGIVTLEDTLLGSAQETDDNQVSDSDAQGSQLEALRINTTGGDEVRLRFATLEGRDAHESSPQLAINENNTQANSAFRSFEHSSLSFSISGELNEDDMTALRELVEKASDLSETFFAGDIDNAFEQALSLGFDDSELVEVALQFNKREPNQVIQQYEQVQNDTENTQGQVGSNIKPIADYLDKFLETMTLSEQSLGSEGDYSTLVNGIINQMESVHTPDLVSAINRFHTFNQRLV